MILRTLALIVGVPLVLISLLATIIGIGMIGDPGPQGADRAGGAVMIVAQIVAVLLVASPGLLGAYLVRLGIRKRQPQAEKNPAVPMSAGFSTASTSTMKTPPSYAPPQPRTAEHQQPPHETQQATSSGSSTMQQILEMDPSQTDQPAADYPSSTGATGQLIGRCGPHVSGQVHYYVIGAVEIALGLAAMLFFEQLAKPGHEASAQVAGLWIGGLLGLKGFIMIALIMMCAPQKITLFDDRLVEERGSKSRTIRLEQVIRMSLQEFYEHRFAPQTYLVTLHVNGDRKLKFTTAMGGDANSMIQYLRVIVPDVEVKEFMA